MKHFWFYTVTVGKHLFVFHIKTCIAAHVFLRNYTGLLPTCQGRGNRLKYTYDARRRTASPSGRKSNAQSVGRGTAAVERAIGPSGCSDQGTRRPRGQR